MDHFLNNNHLEYIFYHLSGFLEKKTFQDIQSKFHFVKQENSENSDEIKIIFNLSSQKLEFQNIIWIQDIPVLFPLGIERSFYSIQGKKLIFHHDILKSCFYLLSGYQEYKSYYKDNLGRFPYYESIQYKLGILHKPIVNYYFEILLKGFEEFCQVNNLPFKRNSIFSNWKVLLTHDIDKLDTYTLSSLIYRTKQLLGISPRRFNKNQHFKLFTKYIKGFLTRKKLNPHWDFDWLRNIESKFGYKSVFYFLPKDIRHHDSSYEFHEKRLVSLFKKLDQEGCEIGLHGTVRSSENISSMQETFKKLTRTSPQQPVGIRQHRLLFKHPETLKIQKSCGFEYDTTLGFAGHEGFRNSYCLPFKIYDFENDQMINIWEIPLVAMDGTLFSYRNLSTNEAEKIILKLVNEVKKFNGIFTFLWHNGFEIDNPNKAIPAFYENVLKLFYENNGEHILGREIIQLFNSHKLEK